MIRKAWLVLVFTSLVLGGAALNEASANILSSEERRPLLMVVMGGNASRRPVHNGRFTDATGSDLFVEALNARRDLMRYSVPEVEILQSSYADYRETDMVFYSFTGDGGRSRTTSIDRYVRYVEDVVDRYQDHDVAMIGHSYGGWLALKAALAMFPKRNLRYLATIDAISRRHCFYAVPIPRGCTEAPRDFSTLALGRLGRGLSQFDNFFQTTTSFLHSARIPGAKTNIFVHNTRHGDIDESQTVWRRIVSELKAGWRDRRR